MPRGVTRGSGAAGTRPARIYSGTLFTAALNYVDLLPAFIGPLRAAPTTPRPSNSPTFGSFPPFVRKNFCLQNAPQNCT